MHLIRCKCYFALLLIHLSSSLSIRLVVSRFWISSIYPVCILPLGCLVYLSNILSTPSHIFILFCINSFVFFSTNNLPIKEFVKVSELSIYRDTSYLWQPKIEITTNSISSTSLAIFNLTESSKMITCSHVWLNTIKIRHV